MIDTDRLEQALCAQAVLGDERILDRLSLSRSDFGDPVAATVYAAASLVHEQGELPTPGAVEAQLRLDGLLTKRERHLLDSLRRDEALTKLEEAALLEQVELRRIATAAATIAKAAERGDLKSARSAASVLSAARDVGTQGGTSVNAKEAALEAIESVFARDGSGRTIPFGLDHITHQLGNFDPGSLLVLGADTGTGKSTTAIAMAMGQATAGVTTGIVSLEDSRHIYGTRFAGHWSRVQPRRMRSKLNPEEYARLGQLPEHCPDPGIWIEDPIGGTDDDVCAAMRRLVHQRGAQVLYVDYVQAIRSTSRSRERRDQVAASASRCKAQAAALGVPLVLVSQLRRPDRDKAREPSRHDLKETGDLENGAEYIVLLWLADPENRDSINAKIEKSKLGCEKPLFRLVRGEGGMLREATPYD